MFLNEPFLRVLLLTAVFLIGCHTADQSAISSLQKQSATPSGVWMITKLNVDRGHLTLDDAARDHIYIRGVECTQGKWTVMLLYYDQVPDGLSLAVGEQIAISSNEDAVFDTSFDGFWMHELKISSLESTL